MTSDEPEAAASEALAMPIEIRAADSSLVARVTVDDADQVAGNLEAGEYHVGVTMPSGKKTYRTVVLGEGGVNSLRDAITEWPTIKAHLSDRIADAASAAVNVIEADDQGQIAIRGGIRAARGRSRPGAPKRSLLRTIGLIEGSGSKASLPGMLRLRAMGCDVVVERPLGASVGTVQIIDPDVPPLNVVVPPASSLAISHDGDGVRCVDLVTGLACADDLLRLRREQRLDEFATMVTSLGPDVVKRHSELLLSGALVMAYALLRSGSPEQMREASQHLLLARPDDPDVLAIAGELWAREGNHIAAMRCFLDALTYGLPAFSFGLNYIVERLRLYSVAKILAPTEDQQPEIDGLIASSKERFEQVQAVALRMDFEGAVTAYEGYDPSNPLALRPQLNLLTVLSAVATVAATAWLGTRALRREATAPVGSDP